MSSRWWIPQRGKHRGRLNCRLRQWTGRYSRTPVMKELTGSGTLAVWEMINPHSWFHLNVKGPDGKITEWMIEGGSPNTLIRLGVTKYTIKVGTELTVEGYQAKEGTNKAVGRNFILPDGSRLFLSLNGAVPGGAPDK